MQRTFSDKPALRAWVLRRRARTDAATVVRASEAIARRVAATRDYAQAHGVAGYLALPGELSPAALLTLCHAEGKQVAVPAWNPVERRYAFCLWTPDTPLALGPMRVPQPRRPVWLSPLRLDLVLVPGLAFGRDGGRIGFGAGHYDRLLRACANGARFMGLAYPWQVLDHVPQDAHDVRLHAVATPSGIVAGHQRTGEDEGGMFAEPVRGH